MLKRCHHRQSGFHACLWNEMFKIFAGWIFRLSFSLKVHEFYPIVARFPASVGIRNSICSVIFSNHNITTLFWRDIGSFLTKNSWAVIIICVLIILIWVASTSTTLEYIYQNQTQVQTLVDFIFLRSRYKICIAWYFYTVGQKETTKKKIQVKMIIIMEMCSPLTRLITRRSRASFIMCNPLFFKSGAYGHIPWLMLQMRILFILFKELSTWIFFSLF